jgi:hypothetical protein
LLKRASQDPKSLSAREKIVEDGTLMNGLNSQANPNSNVKSFFSLFFNLILIIMENENIDVQSLEYALTFKTSEDFQKFVDEHPEIERLEDLRDNYYRIHNRYVNLKQNKKIKPITFKKVKFNWENLKTKDDFQRFIDDNKIESSSVIWKKYSGFASRAKRLGIRILDLKFHHVPDKYELVTVEDANKFVKDHNINSLNLNNKKQKVQIRTNSDER